ncbi:MAG TPA: TonB-dependent receptor [Sphingomicrobium sp.]|nr:TonB-dependent receptor [Sphingomicrobium sp.]
MKSATWNRLLATTVISGFATVAMAAPAWAQTQQPAPTTQDVPVPQSPTPTTGGDAPELEPSDEAPGVSTTGTAGTTIVVTGSRIPRPDLTSSSPVTIVDDEQVALTGTSTLETLINDLPQLIPGNNRTSNNAGGFPFATLDLRGLGPQRTLILVDGERLPPSSTVGVVDISQVPVGLIERIDVVTGGASAIYGSDAMAGVVNFILKQDFSGLELTGQTGVAEEGVGFNYNIAGLLGGNFADGRGNMTLYAGYFDREGVGQGRYDHSRTSAAVWCIPAAPATTCVAGSTLVVVDDPNNPPAGAIPFSAGGSATPPWGQVVNSAANPFNIAALQAAFPTRPFGTVNAPAGCLPTGSNLSFNDLGQLTSYYGAGFCQVPIRALGSSRYNFAPDNFMTIPYNRFNLSSTARYEFDDRTRARIFAAFTNSNSTVELAPTPAAGGTGFTINPVVVNANCTGAQAACALPADLQFALNTRPNPNAPFSFDRRFSETGPRVGVAENQSIIGRGVLEHDLGADWRVYGGFGWGRSDLTSRNYGNINRVAVEQGLVGCRNAAGVVNGPGVLPGCVPVNIYGPNTLTPQMVNFIQIDTTDRSQFEQLRTSVNLAGSAFELPGGPIGIAVGAEWRRDVGSFEPDDAKIRGEIIGFNAQQPQRGRIGVKEAYGEVRLPILGGSGFPDLLAVELGGRFSDYTTIGGIFNWKAAAEFGPMPGLRFRGAYNKAARAPSIFELFQGGDQGFPAYTDPCAATNPNRNVQFCIAQGVPAAAIPTFAANNQQVQAFAFGQPDLEEEKAETYTLGAVFNPSWWPVGRLSLTVDYYDIVIKGRIQGLSAQFYINQCNASANLASDACQRVFRNPDTGQIDRVNTGRRNSPDEGGPFETRGIDAGLNWVVPFADVLGGGFLPDARLRVGNIFSYTMDYKLGGVDFVDTATAGLGGVNPKWGNTLTVGVEQGPWTGQVRWIYKSGGSQVGQIFSSAFNVPRVPDLSFFDLSMRWAINDRFEFTGIVNNLFDKLPPQTVSGTFEQSNTNASFFSPIILGRGYTIQTKVRF